MDLIVTIASGLRPQHGPLSQVSEQTSIVTGTLYQHRPWLQYGHGLWHGPQLHLWLWCHHDITMSGTGHSDLMHPGPRTPTWTQMTDLTLGVPIVLGYNRSHIHQSRPWLLEVHRPRHGPWLLASFLIRPPSCMMLFFTDNGGLPLLTFNSLTYYSLNPVLFCLMINKKLLFSFYFTLCQLLTCITIFNYTSSSSTPLSLWDPSFSVLITYLCVCVVHWS